MQDLPETPEQRRQRRRLRRWKRRARIIGPFLGVPLLLGALALSVDLIEYQPQPKRERLSDRPIRIPAKPAGQTNPRPVVPVEARTPTSLHPAVPGDAVGYRSDSVDIDVMLPEQTALRLPAPPRARSSR